MIHSFHRTDLGVKVQAIATPTAWLIVSQVYLINIVI